jgi:hypothetical protein
LSQVCTIKLSFDNWPDVVFLHSWVPNLIRTYPSTYVGHMYLYIDMDNCRCIHIQVHTHVGTYIGTYIDTFKFRYIRTYVDTYIVKLSISLYVYVYACMYVCMYLCSRFT